MSDFSTVETIASAQADTAVPSFTELGLEARIVAALTKNNLTTPTPIQAQAIPYLLQGKDLIASAQTGTGKTAAFMLPALHRLSENVRGQGRGPRILVLTPTRELAQQVSDASRMFSREMSRVFTLCVTGGMPFRAQREALSRPVEVLVATPGRLLDLIEARVVDFRRLDTFVLDEADRMLDMGFSDDVLAIAEQLPKERQTVFFTATMNNTVNDFAAHLLRDPATIEIAARTERHENIEQKLCYTDGLEHKRKLLDHFLQSDEVRQAIIFTATKRDCDQLANELDASGIRAAALHGDMRQRDRQRTVDSLKRGHCDILVATDVAARGLDIAGISHVFNFDLPKFAEDYVHRIGRTGRAGAKGVAISLVGRIDVGPLKRIERFIGQRLEELQVNGLEARFRPAPAAAGRGGKPGGGGGGFGKRQGSGFSKGQSRGFSGGQDRAPRGGDGDWKRSRDSQGFAGDVARTPRGEGRSYSGERNTTERSFGQERSFGGGARRTEDGNNSGRREYGQGRGGFDGQPRAGFDGQHHGGFGNGGNRSGFSGHREAHGHRNEGSSHRSEGGRFSSNGGGQRQGHDSRAPRSFGGGGGQRRNFRDTV